MEALSENHSEDGVKKIRSSKQSSVVSSESVKKASKLAKPGVVMPASQSSGTVSSVRKKMGYVGAPDMSSSRSNSSFMKPTISSNAAPLHRRNSTGGMAEKHAASAPKRQENGGAMDDKKVSPSISDPGNRSNIESRHSSLPSVSSKAPSLVTRSAMKKSPTLSHMSSTRSDSSKAHSTPKPSVRPSPSVSSSKRVPSTSVDSSTGRSSLRRVVSNVSSPLAFSPSVSSSSKLGSLSSSVDRGSSISGRRKASTPESCDTRLIMLPQIDVKAGDERRLDLRGHRVRSLGALNLSPNLEV